MSHSTKHVYYSGMHKDGDFKRLHHRKNRLRLRNELTYGEEADILSHNREYRLAGVSYYDICDYGWFYTDEYIRREIDNFNNKVIYDHERYRWGFRTSSHNIDWIIRMKRK